MRLENWWFFVDDDVLVAYGYVYGSSRHANGTLISTSKIIGVESENPLRVQTRSGGVYELGSPDWEGHPSLIKVGCKKLGIRLKR